MLADLALEPSAIVGSGDAGIHPYWILSEPWLFDDDAERTAAATMCRNWVATVDGVAHAHGWRVDHVGDLARIMRAPGSVNTKRGGREPVEVLALTDRRYSPDDVIDASVAGEFSDPAALVKVSPVIINPSDGVPPMVVDLIGRLEVLEAN